MSEGNYCIFCKVFSSLALTLLKPFGWLQSLRCLWGLPLSGPASHFQIWSSPPTLKKTWMTSPVFTRVKVRNEARLILPHGPRVNDKWHFPFVIFEIFVDLFGGFCWIPRNGLWLSPILAISTLHLWNPSTGHLPSFRVLTPAWQGAGDTKKARVDEKEEVGCFSFFIFFFLEKGGGGVWNGCTVGVNPSQFRDFGRHLQASLPH